MIEHLKDLRDAGVTSLKIEGRAKSAYYVAVVVNAYRNAIDKLLSDESIEDWIKDEVNNVSHRPYSTGFFYGHPNDCQYYKSSGYVRDRDFIGVVNGYDGKYIEIVQRNYFTVNDDIEILAPGEKPVKLVFKSMKNSKMEDVEIANHANETIYFESENGFPKHSILRKRL